MRPLPVVSTLQAAVIAVINSNTKDGYPPTRFNQITAAGYADNLKTICERLILKGDVLIAMANALSKCKSLLSLEDLVMESGKDWGFSDEAMTTAKARVQYFDKLVGFQRYKHS